MNNSKAVIALAISSMFVAGCTVTGSNGPGNGEQELTTSKPLSNFNDNFSRGVYAAVGIGPSRMEPDTTALADWNPNDRVEPAGQVTLGADLTKHLSIEAHSADLGSVGLSPRGRINYHINGASALVYAGGNRHRYRRQGLTGYGRIGLGVLENTAVGDVPFVKRNGTHVLFGAGVEYMTPIGVGFRVEGISFDKDAKYAQLALMYRTGRKKIREQPKLAAATAAAVPVQAASAPVKASNKSTYEVNRCAGIKRGLKSVAFENDSAGLTAAAISTLNVVASTLRTCSGLTVEVAAHTDAIGSKAYNQALSERRAQSVVNYLNMQGPYKQQLKATAFGETNPIDSNATEAGRARNRRVEIFAR